MTEQQYALISCLNKDLQKSKECASVNLLIRIKQK